ncbi:MAG: mercury methylation corrinoid protein HgcA [Thermodesulfobacteriota bacterium]
MTQNLLNIPVFQPEDDSPCCGSSVAPPADVSERAGYTICRFVDGFVDTGAGLVPRVATHLTWRDRIGAAKVRLGAWRDSYLVSPGLYCVGDPGQESPVLVTANYKLTFDSLRRELSTQDVWILVLDTRGVNVWCASAHKTFGTDELLQRIETSELGKVVNHRRLIVPQLGASGVDAQAIKSASDFEVVWGPIRAGDIPQFLADANKADAAMRKLTFTLAERLVLAPVELAMTIKPTLLILVVMLVVSGLGPGFFSLGVAWPRWLFFATALLVGLLSGVVLVPALLPWLPFRAFYLKGILVALPTAAGVIFWFGSSFWPEVVAQVLICLTASSYLAMNFTGATPYASPSGVEKEMRRAIPAQIVMTLVAVALWVANPFLG